MKRTDRENRHPEEAAKPEQDEELMLRIGRGDLDAFTLLYSRYWRAVFHFFHRMGVAPQLAEEYTQEVFINLWRHAPHYRKRGKFTTFLFTIAKNYYIDEQRKSSRRFISVERVDTRRELSVEDGRAERGMEAAATTTNAAPDQHAITAELRGELRRALAKLPEEQRLVVVLSEYCGLSYREIAEALDCPIGTVSSRKNIALHRLREVLCKFKREWDEA